MKPDLEHTRALVALRRLGGGAGPRALAAVLGTEKADAERILQSLALAGLVSPPAEAGVCKITEAGRTALS